MSKHVSLKASAGDVFIKRRQGLSDKMREFLYERANMVVNTIFSKYLQKYI